MGASRAITRIGEGGDFSMSRNITLGIAAAALTGLLVAGGPARAISKEGLGFEQTPPRLSFIDGEVSFYRPGAEDWAPASVNTALAAGDELYAGEAANLELQIAARAFVRAGEETELALGSLEPDYIQLRVTEGHLSLDLRSVKPSQTIEIATPNAAFTIERSGYYRVEVTENTTSFITRRGGRASVTPARGAPAALEASEQVVITGLGEPVLETYAAPELDAWDRWNYARTDEQLDAVSARYVPSGMYGVDDLDRAGTWRVVPTYGAVWVPRGVAVGWAPYSAGRWMYDAYYGWTWVDAAPWGWAPYHYGRWVHVSGYWAWSPGPVVVRPYYAPALVAFFGGGGVSVGVSIGQPYVGWVALGWGEPLVPWWGPVGFRGVPHWAGWAGPRVVNKVVIKRKTVIHANDIRDYRNTRVRDALVAVDRKHFGRRPVAGSRIATASAEGFAPAGGDLDLRPTRESLVASTGPGRRPPKEWRERSVVATRAPRVEAVPDLESPRPGPTPKGAVGRARAKRSRAEAAAPAPPVRLVEAPRSRERTESLARPPFGVRGEGERATPPPLPRYRREPTRADEERKAPRARMAKAPAKAAKAEPERTPRAPAPTAKLGEPSAPGVRSATRSPSLPGEPANRVFRRRGKHAERKARERRDDQTDPRKDFRNRGARKLR
jgi:hypothetical protein